MDIKNETYLIPLEQVVRDFGSVVTWRLCMIEKRTRNKRRRSAKDKRLRLTKYLLRFSDWPHILTLYQ